MDKKYAIFDMDGTRLGSGTNIALLRWVRV